MEYDIWDDRIVVILAGAFGVLGVQALAGEEDVDLQ